MRANFPVDPARPPGRRRLGLGPRSEDPDQLVGQRRAIEIGERERQVSQRRVGKPVAHAVQAVGRLEASCAPRAQGVQERRPGLVIVAARAWRIPRSDKPTAWSRTLTSVSSPSGSAEASAQTTAAEAKPSLAGAAGAFWPSAGRDSPLTQGQPPSWILSGDSRRDQPLNSLSQPLGLGRGRRAGRAQILQCRGGRKQLGRAIGRRVGRRIADPSSGILHRDSQNCRIRIVADGHLDQHPLEASATTTISISGFSYDRPGGSPTNTVVLSLPVPDSDAMASTPQGRTGTSTDLIARGADRAR